jgi:hypothetical protein
LASLRSTGDAWTMKDTEGNAHKTEVISDKRTVRRISHSNTVIRVDCFVP